MNNVDDCFNGNKYEFRYSIKDLSEELKQKYNTEPIYDGICAKLKPCCWKTKIDGRQFCAVEDSIVKIIEDEMKLNDN